MLRIIITVVSSVIATTAAAVEFDVIIRNGSVYDGTGAAPYIADLGIREDRISAIGQIPSGSATLEIDATGLAVAPGFFNMLSHSHLSLISDGRAMSDVMQGVTFEALSEISFSPLTTTSAAFWSYFSNEKVDMTWTTVDDYLRTVEAGGVSVNFATFVSAATVRMNIIGTDDVDPTPEQLDKMKLQVAQAMEDGALGLTTFLIYAPATYAETEELIELAKVVSHYGGVYTAHIRSESNRLIESVDETLRIGREAKLPVRIHHLKAAGKPNWHKMDLAIEKIEASRREGVPVTADMYTYVAGGSGLEAAMPTWVQAGGYRKWAERLKDPKIRDRVKSEMGVNTQEWENLGYLATPDGMVFLEFKNEALHKYVGKTLAEVATERGQDPRDTIIDLVLEDGSRVSTAYYLMSEENLKKKMRQPWVMFGSDATAPAAEGRALNSGVHPRTYGNVARLLGKYVREEKVLAMEEAIRKLTLLPAQSLGIRERGRIKLGYFADIAIFDPDAIEDKATFSTPHQYSVGMEHVLVNGQPVVFEGRHTGARPGRAIRGSGWMR